MKNDNTLFATIYEEYNTNPVWYEQFDEDLLNDAMIVYLEKENLNINNEVEMKRYIYSTMWYLNKNKQRREHKEWVRNNENADEITMHMYEQSYTQADYEQEMKDEINLKQIYHFINNNLSPVHRSVYTMYLHGGHKTKYIAEKLGLKINTCYTYIKECNALINKNFGFYKSQTFRTLDKPEGYTEKID